MAATSIDTNKVSTYAVQDYSLAYNSCSNSISKCSELYSLLPNDFPQKATVGSIVNNLSTLKSDINSNKEVILSKIKYILSTESNSKSSALLMGKSAEELELEEELRTYGFTEPDIERIMNGEITPEDLKKEIDNDKDPSRRRYMLEAQMLNNSQVSATNMEELKILQEVTKNELEKLIAKKQHSKLETLEIPELLNIIERIQNGEDLEYVINSEIIAWKYVNEEGEECYKYTDPYITGYDGSITYEPITYNQMFKDSKYLKELKTITEKVEVNRMLVSSTPKELIDFFEKLNNENANINTAMEELDKSIEEKNMELNTYLYLENYITEEVDNYINNIDPYVRNENFEKNSVMNEKEVLDTLNKIDQRYTEGLELLGSTYACVVGDNKEELMQIFSYIINGKNEKGDVGNLYIPSSDRKIAVYYNDPIIANFQKWQGHMSEDEIKVFNYIYNTQSADEAYAYLENISKTLDSRWVVAKTREDQEYATEHPVAASIASIFITPVEGIFAGISSLNYKIHGGELYRSDVYSSGAVLRAAVSENIGEKTQVGKFFYDAGMSMADSLVTVGAAVVTGGATVSTSSILMGTRSFVCTLNDALDRGIDTDKAILLATTSAAVEILAESYSLGHFMNLEGKMGKYVSDLTTKVAQKFNDPVMAKAASKLVYIFGGLISQGPVEAEEEVATEILNNFADEVISGDLSNFSLSVKNYMELGFTEEEATNMAINDNLENIVKVFLSSFLTGGVMGGASAGISSYNISRSINQEMLNQYNGNSALAFADIVSYNTNIARLETELNKNLTKQKLREIGNKVKDFFKKNNSNGNFSIINSELDPVISDFEQAYELYSRGGLANMLVTTEKGENGKKSGYSLFSSLDYAGGPTLVSSEEFENLSSKSQYGTLVRGVSGPLAVQYASQFKTGDLYVGGANASIRGTGVYAAYGIDSTNVKQNYASNSGTTSGQVLEMTLSQDAKVIDYKTVSSEQAKVLDIMARKFTKYDSAIVDFDTLCANLDKITDVNAKNEAKFITNVLSDVGYYAALKGYDAIVDTEKGYFNILNRSKVYVKDNGPNISNINNTIATILKVEDLDTSINMNDRYAVNINATYKGYDYVIKPKSDLKVVLNEIINNNDGSKVLIEISSINDLTLDMLENIPDNVNIRINDYNMDFYQSFRKSRQKAVEAINEYLTYTASELKLIVKELNNIKSGINESWNDYQKAKYVYDYMVNNIEYQEPLSIIGRNKHFDGLMSLVDKVSTCSGFAHTYSAILNNIGIKCSTIWGNMNGVGNHAYNIVSIDGNNFIVDTTRESINQIKQGGFEGTGFGVQNVEQYVATSNVSLLENVNSTFNSISNKIDFKNKEDIDVNSKKTGSENILDANVENKKIMDFISFVNNFKEEVKKYTNKTDEQLPHFKAFENKIIEYGNIDNIINNLDNFSNWEMKRLLDLDSPILIELFNSQKIMDYVKNNMSKEDILNYGERLYNNSLIISTLLSLTNEELDGLSSYIIFNIFDKLPTDIQKQFIDSHMDFFEKNLGSIFSKSLSKDTFMTIFDKISNYEIIKSKIRDISDLDSEIQNALYTKYQQDIYKDSQLNFIEFAIRLKDGNYQEKFIKNSPFYNEIVNSSKFEDLLLNIKNKGFMLELLQIPDTMVIMQQNPEVFRNFITMLTVEEQYEYKEFAKKQILDVNNSQTKGVLKSSKVYSYIRGFNENIQQELLNDPEIIGSMSIETMIQINSQFNGIYLKIMKEMINGNFSEESANMLFEPSIYELMDQETINRAALALSIYKYRNLANLGNIEAINLVIDKIVTSNFNQISWYNADNLIFLYEATNDIGKQKIASNIPFGTLINAIDSLYGEKFADILVNRFKTQNVPEKIFISDLIKISRFKPGAYEKIFPYLSNKQKLVTFNYNTANKLGITEEFVNVFRENPDLINHMDKDHGQVCQFLQLLSSNVDIDLFYNSITLETLLNVGSSSKFNIMDLEKVKIILKDGLLNYEFKYVEEFTGLASILDNYSVSEQVEILNSIGTENKYFLLLSGKIKNKETKFEMIKLLINDQDFRTSISSGNIKYFKNFLDNLEIEYVDYILKNANDHFLGFMLTLTKRNDLNIKFNEMINKNSMILNKFEYTDAELIYENLSTENKTLLDNKINSMILNIGNDKINVLLESATTAQKSSFLEAYNKGLITEEKLELLYNLQLKNKYVLSSFNYNLFDNELYKLGPELLTKLSKYYDVVNQLVELKKSPEKFNLFINMITYDDSSSALVTDQKMASLLNYLLKNEVSNEIFAYTNSLDVKQARNIILRDIDYFSICDHLGNEIKRKRSLIKPDNYTLSNYYDRLSQKCDSLLESATTIEEVQNLFFNKYYSISIEDAREMFRVYGNRFSEIKNLDNIGIATIYLENMYNILNVDSMEEAIDIYNNFSHNFTMDELLTIMNEIKKIYTKSLKNTLYIPNEITGYVDYNGTKIPIYKPKGDFQLLIQSTFTNYGGMPMINNSYYDSWNLSSRTSNHGICCSLISNNNMGMAMVREHGVLIGFNSFSDEQINMMAPYDIYTMNDGYVIKCQRPLQFLPGQDVMNETRHTHNEFNLERTNLTGVGNLANIQPDYVVVFEEMNDEQKQNAYKASLDFSVPLVYINKTELAASESAKIDSLILEYKTTGNIELLQNILVLHENNRSGYRVSEPKLVEEYFKSDRVVEVFNSAIDGTTSVKELLQIKEILEDENRKFDQTNESVNRINNIDIPVSELITRIDEKIKNNS